MKIRNFILSLIALFAFCSCADMFEPAIERLDTEEGMIDQPDYAAGLLMYAYNLLPYSYSSNWDVATDDAVTNNTKSSYLQMALGTWSASNNPMSQWDSRKCAIQYANLFLSKVNDVRWAPSSASKNKMFIDRLKGEAFALRAIQYYYLLMAHGGYADDGVLYGVPMLTEQETATSNYNQPRATFADCVKQMYADCDSAIALLPLDYVSVATIEDVPQKYRSIGATLGAYNTVFGEKNTLRISRRIAEAVKSQIALLAASPAFSEQSGVTYEEAAQLAAKVLNNNNGIAGMDPKGHLYYFKADSIKNAKADIPEALWRDNFGNENSTIEAEIFPPTLKGSGRINPSQNLVDVFPMKNGYPITDKANSGYDAKNPYANRDPRLTNYILYNESSLNGTTIVTGTYPDADAQTEDNLNSIEKSTRTGYYLKKLACDDCSPDPMLSKSRFHAKMRIRYTEIFLAYAEAANEAWGPKADGGNGFSAYDVIKAIRQRAGIEGSDPYLEACANDKAAMRELIRNERRIELCFENKRFWDLRRWKMPLNETVMGVQIDRSADGTTLTYTPIVVEERKYDDSYQWYGPIPQQEVLKWSNLKQNKGWR